MDISCPRSAMTESIWKTTINKLQFQNFSYRFIATGRCNRKQQIDYVVCMLIVTQLTQQRAEICSVIKARSMV